MFMTGLGRRRSFSCQAVLAVRHTDLGSESLKCLPMGHRWVLEKGNSTIASDSAFSELKRECYDDKDE